MPVNIAGQVVPTLIKGEDYEYAWLGISGRTVTPELADLMDLPDDTKGALVISVSQDGPADTAGLQGSDKLMTVDGAEYQVGGDVITTIDGEPVEDMDGLITHLIAETRPGDKTALDVLRSDGSRETITVTLGTRPGVDALSQEE